MKPLKELQLLAAKKLPEKIHVATNFIFGSDGTLVESSIRWKHRLGGVLGDKVKETEWLYICIELLEPIISDNAGEHGEEYSKREDYALALLGIVGTHKPKRWGGECVADFYLIASSTAHQRLQAMNEIGFI